jgi:serine-type D-Ala-D-Ala carboxypeptidase
LYTLGYRCGYEIFFKVNFRMKIKQFLPFLVMIFLVISCEVEPPLEQQYLQADERIEADLKDSLFVGAVLLVGNSDEILHHSAFGYADRYNFHGEVIDNPEEMTTDHLFDLASLTKVLATTFGLMILHDQNLFDVEDPVSLYLPEFDTPDKRSITISQLLRHTSGLMQWFPSYYVAETPEDRLQFTANEPMLGSPGETRRYSDYGFMVLGDLIERVSGQPLDLFLEESIFGPMGLSSTVFNPDVTRYPKISATSHGNPFEKKMVYDDDFGYTVDVDPESWSGWREYTLRGEVNDGNAFYTQRGVAGHAGLFSTAEEVYKLLNVMLNAGKFQDLELFSRNTMDLFLTEDSHGHGLGWMMTPGSLHARNLPEGSFGHTGFTGTNIVVSPENNRIMIFLTNRQHVGVDEEGNYPNLRKIREDLSEIIFSD